MADFELFDAVYKQLKSPDVPARFIAVVSTIDTHPPYTAAGDFECRHEFGSDFLKSLHSFDHHLGKFIRRIKNDPELYDRRTLIIITADHSATHGENHLKRSNFNPSRIPLIFITPDTAPLKDLDREKYCSSLDITPTLVRFIGGKIPRSFMGRDLREAKNCAITRSPGDILRVYAPDLTEMISVKLGEKKYDTPEQSAFNDYFNLYYSN